MVQGVAGLDHHLDCRAVISVLSGLGLLPQRRRLEPQTVVIVVTNIEVALVEPRTMYRSESGPELESVA